MNIRMPARSGSFYEGGAASCRRHAEKLFDQVELPDDLPENLLGGLTPHAGWSYSGRLAATTLAALDETRGLETVVLFGADHVGAVSTGEVYPSGVWRTPLGEVSVAEEFASALLEDTEHFRANPDAHAGEHSLEVQIPLLQVCNDRVRIVPIAVPPDATVALAVGKAVGRLIAERFREAVVVGSTDLTHHGGHFGHFGGQGVEGVRWSEANDRRMIDRIEALDAEGIVDEALRHRNACGAGAIAATAAACRDLGARGGHTLAYTNSYRVLHRMVPDETDDTTVGYVSVVFG